MSRRTSFWMLVIATVAVGAYFFHVIRAFLLPVFLAGICAILFWPMYEKAVEWCRGYRRIAAVLTMAGIFTMVFLPLGVTLYFAGQEMMGLAAEWLPEQEQAESNGRLKQHLAQLKQDLSSEEFTELREGILAGKQPTSLVKAPLNPTMTSAIAQLEYEFDRDDVREQLESASLADLVEPEEGSWYDTALTKLNSQLPPGTLDHLPQTLKSASSNIFQQLYARTQGLVANVISALVGFSVMLVTLYYFFVDGQKFVGALEKYLPLEDRDEQALFRRFDEICRGVVLGTVAAALVQSILMGLGLAVAGVSHVWLLAGLTMVCAMLPVVGSAAIYVPVAIVLFTQDRYAAAVLLLLYGAGIVSTSDNLIRAHVLNGRAKLHPLIGFISMLGGLQVIGLWGIFVGPLVAGFFYSLLKILHARLERHDNRRLAGADQGAESTTADAPLSHDPGREIIVSS